MIDSPANIEQVKAEIRMCGENMKLKITIKAVRNTRTNFGCMEYDEPGYYWTDYVTREDTPYPPKEKTICLIQSTMENSVQEGKRGEIHQTQQNSEKPLVLAS